MAACALILAGCSTPPEAMEQANHTVKLMSLMEQPLAQYRKTWTALETSRLQTLKEQRGLLTESGVAGERSRLARQAAGDTAAQALRENLLANADGIQAARLKAAEDKAAFDKKIDGLLQPLPSTAASVTAAQAAVGTLGTELPLKLRAKELLDFYKEVKAGVDAAEQKKTDAKDAANAAADAASAAFADGKK